MPAARNHYQILNVAPDAEAVVIEAAYRALMKKYHPDQAAPAGEGLGAPSAAEINRAFATLRDAGRRADYDRREWTRSQDIIMAPYHAPAPQRVGRVFGWGGWIVALILGGLLALLAGRGNEAALARADAARAAAEAGGPDLRSQPTLPEEPLTVAPVAAEVSGEVAMSETPLEVPAELAEQQVPAPAAVPVARPEQRRQAGQAKPRRPQPERRARTPAEKDFLEREGYIY
jgi:hypothetical protein